MPTQPDYLLASRFQGLEIIETPYLTVPGEPVTVRHTWRRRLFSWPWRPWVASYTYTPQVPHPGGVQFAPGKIAMHPATAARLREILK